MVFFPPVKLNIGLQVLSKRNDGYHNIDSCFYQVPFGDVLEVVPSDQFQFVGTGLEIPGNSADNLCVKAYNLMAQELNLPPVTIHLHKLAPMGAGLGGGSADAAFVLKALNHLFNLNLSLDQLEQYAAQLGSDCPFFIQGGAQMASETGTTLRPIKIELSGYYLVICSPGVHLGTQEAYAGIVPQADRPSIAELITSPIENWKETIVNDFEQSVFKSYPSIQSAKNELYEQGAVYASMTGSGSAVYGFFEKEVRLKTETQIVWQGFLP